MKSDLISVFNWPEFKAFAERLGIENIDKTTRLVIDMRMGYQVEIVQTYIGEDMK